MVNFSKGKAATHELVFIDGMAVERITNFKFLGLFIFEDLSWAHQIDATPRKAHQNFNFLATIEKIWFVIKYSVKLSQEYGRGQTDWSHHDPVWLPGTPRNKGKLRKW